MLLCRISLPTLKKTNASQATQKTTRVISEHHPFFNFLHHIKCHPPVKILMKPARQTISIPAANSASCTAASNSSRLLYFLWSITWYIITGSRYEILRKKNYHFIESKVQLCTSLFYRKPCTHTNVKTVI